MNVLRVIGLPSYHLDHVSLQSVNYLQSFNRLRSLNLPAGQGLQARLGSAIGSALLGCFLINPGTLQAATPTDRSPADSPAFRSRVLMPQASIAQALITQALITQAPIAQVIVTEKRDRFTLGDPTRSEPGYREANLRIPVISGISDPTLLNKVQQAISLKSVFGQSLEEMRAEFPEYHWLTRLDYQVNYNANSILDLTYFVEGLGAYPSGFERHIAVDLKTGKVLRPHDLFKTQALGSLARRVEQKMQQAIQTKRAQLAQDNQDVGEELFQNHRFRIRNLENFSITPEGVTFHYDYGFPHVVLAAEPEGKFSFTYAELQPFIKPNGAIATLVP
ncbi:MAG: hypothetical protein VKJ24_04010 [Synechococcales bacterium]|nr:hypothetical protein [Synechococcales bacterium]